MRHPEERGFSLIEIMIALGITTFVLAGAYTAYINLHKWWVAEGLKSSMRQNARVGLDALERDIEMAGYQTQANGDANMTNLPFTQATPSSIEMNVHVWNFDNINKSGYVWTTVYYHLATDRNGNQNLYKQYRPAPGQPSPNGDQLVAENITNLTFTYYGAGGGAKNGQNTPISLTPPIPQYVFMGGVAPDPRLQSIRRIVISITAGQPRNGPIIQTLGGAPPTVTLTADVFPKNLAQQEDVTDTTPPAIPTGLHVVDSRSCINKLQASWTANTELDLAGYDLYYGGPNPMNIPLSSLANPAKPSVYLNPS
ncbi:MAG: prepilin-type N-terminal cleavage/methylation domain-containing protein, partial [Nitrospirota bacterium]